MTRKGYFGQFGGRYVPETLIPVLDDLEEAYLKYSRDRDFNTELKHLLSKYSGRPTPLYFSERLTEEFGGAKVYLKKRGS